MNTETIGVFTAQAEIRQIVQDEIAKAHWNAMIESYGKASVQGLARNLQKHFPDSIPDLPELKNHERCEHED